MARKEVDRYAVFDNVGGSKSIIFYYRTGGADVASNISAEEADYIVDLLRHEKPMSYDHVCKRLSTLRPEPVGEAETTPELDEWLSAHASVANAIVWEDSAGAHTWGSWSSSRKAQLRSAFQSAWVRSSISLPEIPANQKELADEDIAVTVLSTSDAWNLYRATVAHCLMVELASHVGWSITGYNDEQLAQLFDSRRMFHWGTGPDGYYSRSELGRLIPGPPRRLYEFIAANDLLGWSRFDTIGRTIDWCRDNLIHFSGGFTAANVEDQWQYRGSPPILRVIEGTPQTSNPTWGVRKRTAGCRGTSGFFCVILRLLNIPVTIVFHAGHALPHFLSPNRYLSHGDDPYNVLAKTVPEHPATEIMIDQAKYEAWFGPGVPAHEQSDNIGRRNRELAVVYLPPYLLHKHCDDIADGHSHADSRVFDVLKRNYTVAELEAESLWDRMNARITSFGGCDNVP